MAGNPLPPGSITEIRIDTTTNDIGDIIFTPAEDRTVANMKDNTGRRLDSIEVVAKPGTCTPPMMLTAPNALSGVSALNLLQRTMTMLTVDSVRRRNGFRNLNLRDNVVPTTPATIEGVYVGEPAFATSSTSGARWVGDCKATMTQVSGNSPSPSTEPASDRAGSPARQPNSRKA